jgi:chitodextrinase
MKLQEAFDAGFDAVKSYIDQALADADKRNDARLSAMEAKIEAKLAALKYLGVWSESVKYVEGNSVTHDGSTWTARIESRGVKPGGGGAVWQLSVKGSR